MENRTAKTMSTTNKILSWLARIWERIFGPLMELSVWLTYCLFNYTNISGVFSLSTYILIKFDIGSNPVPIQHPVFKTFSALNHLAYRWWAIELSHFMFDQTVKGVCVCVFSCARENERVRLTEIERKRNAIWLTNCVMDEKGELSDRNLYCAVEINYRKCFKCTNLS